MLLRFLLLYSFLLIQLTAISQQYNFTIYSVSEGLPQSQVYAILEDSRGYMWFGTRGGGVGIFDGSEFKSISEAEGLVNNFINELKEDENGNIWIGTDGGVSIVTGDTILNYPSGNHFMGHSVRSILLMKGDKALIGTSGGLFEWNDKKVSGVKALRGKSIYDIDSTGEDTYWIAASDGLYERNEGKLTHHRRLTRIGNDEMRAIVKSEDVIWSGSYGGGIVRYDGRFTNISKSDGMPAYVVLDMELDKAGNIWIGTEGGGVLCYNGVFFRQFTINNGLSGNTVRCIYQDSQENMWFGTSGGGIARFDGEMFVHYKPGGGAVYSIAQDSTGALWLGAATGGIIKFTDGISKYLDFTTQKVKIIYPDAAGNMLFGTEGDGLYLYNGKRFRHFTRNNGLSSDWIKAIIQDKAGRYYIGTSGGGVNLVNGKTITRYKRREGLAHDYVNQFGFGPDSALWIATNGGISKWKDGIFTNYTKKEGLISEIVKSACKDFLGNMWFGTVGGGICRLKDGKIENFTTQNGLVSNNTYLLYTTDGKIFWAGSEKGIDKIILDENGDIRNIRHYAKKEGFSGLELMQNSVLADSAGYIWFGTVEGLTRYDPRKDKTALQPPKIYLTDVKLFYEPLQNGKGLKQARWTKLPQDLHLNYDQNHLSFEFAGISLKEGTFLRYRWMLKGFDSEWSPAARQRNATYSNLPPGDYTFVVEAGNDEDQWSQMPASFSFSISEPFWNTWWFIFFSGASVALLGVGLFMYSTAAVRKREQQKNRQLELERNLIQLEQQALRLQMNPHFLFNCLNSIKGLVSENKTQEAKLFISRFARLMRSILENSGDAFITLDEEIKGLQNYIELEKLSIGDKFEFSVSLQKDIDPSSVMLPPMLIQPFVENSLIHGITALPSGGFINVSFLLEDNMLKCVITDNGIGRKKAAEREHGEGKHRSSALKITQDRLNVLSENLNLEQVMIRITDLMTENEEPAGTKVELMIPYRER